MDFKDEILKRSKTLKTEALEAEQRKKEQDQLDRTIEERELRRLQAEHEACLNVGKEVVSLLVECRIPVLDIWDDIKTGESEPFLQNSLSGLPYKSTHTFTTKKIVGQGWHLMTLGRDTRNSDYEIIPDTRNMYMIDTEGELKVFKQLHYDGLRSFNKSSKKENISIDGIIYPTEIPSVSMINLTRSDDYMKAVASLIAQVGVYERIVPAI